MDSTGLGDDITTPGKDGLSLNEPYNHLKYGMGKLGMNTLLLNLNPVPTNIN